MTSTTLSTPPRARGAEALREGDLASARQAFEEALAQDADDLVARHNLGVIAYREGDLAAAEAHLRHACGAATAFLDAAAGSLATIVEARAGARTRDAFVGRAQDALRGFDDADARIDGRLRVGFVSIWFERGQAYVTKAIRDAVARRHETFVFAREGNVWGEKHLVSDGPWNVPNLVRYPSYDIEADTLREWIERERLDAVVFNEEYDWELVRAVRETGAAVITYLDYYKDSWKPHMHLYDAVLCSSRRSLAMVEQVARTHFVGWAVDVEQFRPRPDEARYTFFHNAGWLGIGYRKMTPAVILAFDALSRHLPQATLLIHAQAGLDKLPAPVAEVVRRNPRITYRVETVSAPGLYHLGRILLFPTKLEGLGLPLPEGLACGLPAIATDAAPMNEFVTHGENGLLVRVAQTATRDDNIAIPESRIDVNDLVRQMHRLATDEALYDRLSRAARERAVAQFDAAAFAERVLHVIETVAA